METLGDYTTMNAPPDSQPTDMSYIYESDVESEGEHTINTNESKDSVGGKAKRSDSNAMVPPKKKKKLCPNSGIITSDKHKHPTEELNKGGSSKNTVAETEPAKLIMPLQSTTVFSGRRGVTYSCSDEWRKTSGRFEDLIGHKEGASKLFHHIGGNVYLDKPYVSAYNQGKGENIRMSLWYTNGIMKKQKAGGRFSVSFDQDALYLLKTNLDDIERALTQCDTENFLGYALHLGNKWYCTVERQECSVHFRRWWVLSCDENNPAAELLPSRDGLRLSYEQWRNMRKFVETQVDKVLPMLTSHVFSCDRPSHDSVECTYCNPRGVLPFQNRVNKIMGSAWMTSHGDIISTTLPKQDISERKHHLRFPNVMLSEHDCLELARFIRRTWKMLGVLLGFPIEVIDEIEMSHENTHVQAIMLLTKWTRCEGHNANLNTLMPVFERLSIDFHI